MNTLTCVVWYRMCIDGIVVVSFKCIDLEPMLLVSSSAKSACLYRVICGKKMDELVSKFMKRTDSLERVNELYNQ